MSPREKRNGLTVRAKNKNILKCGGVKYLPDLGIECSGVLEHGGLAIRQEWSQRVSKQRSLDLILEP